MNLFYTRLSILVSFISLFILSTPVLAATSTTGGQNVLVFLINFQDMPTNQPFTVAQAEDIMFGPGASVANFYRENSYGQTWMSGKVAGWYTIPMDSTATCDTAKIATYAQQAAAAAGINLGSYNRFVYVAPSNNNCGNWGGSFAPVYDGPFVHHFNVHIVAHELGHNFGLSHSHGMDCDTGTLGVNCPFIEYGDGLDTMGGGSGSVNETNYTYHFNAAQKERLGWLNSNTNSLITTVISSGTYTIEPYETIGTRAKALKIVKSIDPITGKKTYYYLEYRQPIGFDSGLNYFGFSYNLDNIFNGVIIHKAKEDIGNSIFLLDMTPGSRSTYTGADLRDAALVVGQTYTDSAAGVSISVMSAGSSGITVNVTLSPACKRANPIVSISPAQGPSVTAGTSVIYGYSIKNNDETLCGVSSFNWNGYPSVAGLIGAFNGSSPIEPGATMTGIFTLSSQSSLASGTYTFNLRASNNTDIEFDNNSNGYSGLTTATYTVAGSVVPTPTPTSLAVSLTTNKSVYLKGDVVIITANVSNNGLAVPGASVAFAVTKANGSVVNKTLTTDSYGRAIYKLRTSRKDLSGVFQIKASATSGSSTASASTSFTLQ